MIPRTRTIPADGLWRLICWDAEKQEMTQRIIASWLVSAVPTADGFSFELGLEWTTPPGVTLDDDTAILVPIIIVPPTEQLTVDDVAEASAAGRIEALPYAACPYGLTGCIRRAVESGDDRLKHLLDIGQRMVLAVSVEAAMTEEEPVSGETLESFACPTCGLRFRDVWILGTHRGAAHRVSRPDCTICGNTRCDGPIGSAIHRGLISSEEAVGV